jgi:type II secretory ATPase GspE/PulE/Tfp pilus assembly ATPase PilB-like protein
VELNPAGENTFTVVDFSQKVKAPAFSQLKTERDVGEWLRGIIAEAIKEKSREILIQPESDGASILFRKETFFLSEFSLYPQLQDDFTFFLYRLAKMNPVQQNKSQSGRFAVRIHDRKIVIAVNAFPTIYGTRFLLEMFDEKILRHSYEELTAAFPEMKQQLEYFVMDSYHGMCIITGPEGSGRTSFLYALLSRCKERFARIVTLENSVRYPLHGISQTQVEEGEMEGVLEGVLKQKPDLVAIHSLCSVRAAEIAFLIAARVPVITVMSCYDCFVALQWLCRHHLKSAIKAGLVHTILSPRLIPRSCPSCAAACELTASQRNELGIPPEAELRMNQGCEICKDAAEKDAEVFFEYLRMDQEMISWIEQTPSASFLRKQAREAGRKSLLDVILHRATTGNLDMLSVLKLQSIL